VRTTRKKAGQKVFCVNPTVDLPSAIPELAARASAAARSRPPRRMAGVVVVVVVKGVMRARE
jgi:hypothetical protein